MANAFQAPIPDAFVAAFSDTRDPFFGQTPGALFLGIVVVCVATVVCLAIWRNIRPS